MQHLYEQGKVGVVDLALGLGDYLRYKVGALDLAAWVQGMATPLAGRSEREVLEESREWFEKCVVTMDRRLFLKRGNRCTGPSQKTH